MWCGLFVITSYSIHYTKLYDHLFIQIARLDILVAAENATDRAVAFLHVHQPGAVDVIDDETGEQPHRNNFV